MKMTMTMTMNKLIFNSVMVLMLQLTGALVPCCQTMAATATSTRLSTDSEVTMTTTNGVTTMQNGLVKMVISKGRVTDAYYCKKGDGSSWYRLNTAQQSGNYYFAYLGEGTNSPTTNYTKDVKNTADYAEVQHYSATYTIGYILRRGESGLYMYVSRWRSSTNQTIGEFRMGHRVGTEFTYAYVTDTKQGLQPTTAQMESAEEIGDATYRITEGSTEWPVGKVFTKYDWANYMKDDHLHGMMSPTTGVWVIPCSAEYYNGGPLKQDLTVHAGSTTPIILQMFQGSHYGAGSMNISSDQGSEYNNKSFGPYFIYVNSGNSYREMIEDAKSIAAQKEQEWPFSWFVNSSYPIERTTVKGRIDVSNYAAAKLQVVLSKAKGDPYACGDGYMFYAETDRQGNFSIPKVRRGTYNLYAYAIEGTNTDSLIVNDVMVDGQVKDLGTISWEPDYGECVFSIGEADRRSSEFKYSNVNRYYDQWEEVPADLTYTIGISSPANDWYYAQTKIGTWTVKFNEAATRQIGHYRLTCSMAGFYGTRVNVLLNGSQLTSYSTNSGDNCIRRGALQNGQHFYFSVDIPQTSIKKGDNTLSFTLTKLPASGGVANAGTGGIMWDCIKLEYIYETSASVTVGPEGYATYYNADNGLDFSASAIKAYKAAVDGDVVRLTLLEKVPAATPVIVKGTEGETSTETIPFCNDAPAVEGNSLMVRSTTSTPKESWASLYYVLAKPENSPVGFYPVSVGTTIAAYKPHLEIPKTQALAKYIFFDEGETSGVTLLQDASCYPQSRVHKYIKGGKLLVLRDGNSFLLSGQQIR